MDYQIIWSHFSEKQIDEIYSYYQKRVNTRLAGKIVKEILLAPDKLIKNPKAGVPEPLLGDRPIPYRYIVISNYKVIYSIDEKQRLIKIADVFDTRQNPVKIKQRIK